VRTGELVNHLEPKSKHRHDVIKWMEDKVPNIPLGSVVVTGNVPCDTAQEIRHATAAAYEAVLYCGSKTVKLPWIWK
jgi:hypothetical protein